MKHALSLEVVRDIDGSVVWNYFACTCGWESSCTKSKHDARAEADAHANQEATNRADRDRDERNQEASMRR